MDVQLEKLELIKLLVETNDESIIASIKKIFYSKKKDWWDDLTEEQKEDIELGLEQYKKGEVVTYESILEKHREVEKG